MAQEGDAVAGWVAGVRRRPEAPLRAHQAECGHEPRPQRLRLRRLPAQPRQHGVFRHVRLCLQGARHRLSNRCVQIST